MNAEMARPRVLIVDDDEAIRGLLARILTRADYECAQASNVAEAWAELGRTSFALALCDVQMPGGSGLELAGRILSEFPETATLMVSGLDDAGVAQVALESGAYGYLIKPFRANEILIAASNALRRRSLEIKSNTHQEQLEREVRARTTELQTALERVEASALEVRRSRAETIERLARAVEYRDPETGGHVERMSRYCAVLAGPLDMHSESMRVATPMHDVGKIAIADHILLKPGELTPDERKQMELHPEIGHRILAGSGSSLLELAARIAWTHHEKYDGTGYPRGLAGEDIPLEGRIAAIGDVFDALTSDRVYRPAFSVEEALELMRGECGRHFDPTVLDAFFHALPTIIGIRERYTDAALPAAFATKPLAHASGGR